MGLLWSLAKSVRRLWLIPRSGHGKKIPAKRAIVADPARPVYQRPHGSTAVTATAANSKVRYAIDRWNKRIGAPTGALVSASAPGPAVAGAVTAAARTRASRPCASARNQAPRP